MNAPTGSGKTLAYLAPIVSRPAGAGAAREPRGGHLRPRPGAHPGAVPASVSDILTLLVRRYIWLVSSPRALILLACTLLREFAMMSCRPAAVPVDDSWWCHKLAGGGFSVLLQLCSGAQQGHGGVQLQVLAMSFGMAMHRVGSLAEACMRTLLCIMTCTFWGLRTSAPAEAHVHQRGAPKGAGGMGTCAVPTGG